jgi:alpha-galactosidase
MPGQKSKLAYDGKVLSGDYLMKIGLNLITGDDMSSRIVELTKK